MKVIITSSKHEILVDNEDYPYLSQFFWHVSKTNSNNIYAMRHTVIDAKKTKVYLHRELFNFPEGKMIDHIDRNGLNCQRSNLRVVDRSINAHNRRKTGNTKYIGVCEFKGKFITQLNYKGNRHRSTSNTLEEAALKYNDFALANFGEYANLNVI